MAQITFLPPGSWGGSRLPSPSLRPSLSPGGLQSWPHSCLPGCGLHTCSVSLPQTHSPLLPSASPLLLGAPPLPLCRPLPPLSVPNLAGFTPLHPKAPGSRAPLPFPHATLGFSVSCPATPPYLLSPIPPPGTKPPQFLHHRTWPAGRAATPCRAPPELEEGGGETETRGARQNPAAETAPPPGPPQTRPGPKPTLPPSGRSRAARPLLCC